MKIEKSRMSKSNPYYEILGKKAFRRHLEAWKNQIGSIFKLNIKKSVKFKKKKILPKNFKTGLTF